MGNTLSNIPDPYDPYGFSEKEENEENDEITKSSNVDIVSFPFSRKFFGKQRIDEWLRLVVSYEEQEQVEITLRASAIEELVKDWWWLLKDKESFPYSLQNDDTLKKIRQCIQKNMNGDRSRDTRLEYGGLGKHYEYQTLLFADETFGLKDINNLNITIIPNQKDIHSTFSYTIQHPNQNVPTRRIQTRQFGTLIERIMPGDGNCQFHTIADQMRVHGILSKTPHELRRDAVQYLRENRTHFEPFFLSDLDRPGQHMTFDQYLNYMSDPGIYGDNYTLFALSNILDVHVDIYHWNPRTDTITGKVEMVPSLSLSFKPNRNYTTFSVLYTGIHYNSIIK